MNEEIKKNLQYLINAPVLPIIVTKVFRIIKSQNTGLKDFENLIKCSEDVNSKFLSAVNTDYYGYPQKISTIQKAMVFLGMNRAKDLIVSIAMNAFFLRGHNNALWKHSVQTAVGCEYLTNKFNISDVEDAFMMGLMHDIGKVVIDMQPRTKYDEYDFEQMEKMIMENSCDITNIENSYLGTNHADIGSKLAYNWCFSMRIVNAIKYHHDPLKSPKPIESSLLYFVDNLVQPNYDISNINEKFVSKLNISLNKIDELRGTILEKAAILIDGISA